MGGARVVVCLAWKLLMEARVSLCVAALSSMAHSAVLEECPGRIEVCFAAVQSP
jgi:hypothetical protein